MLDDDAFKNDLADYGEQIIRLSDSELVAEFVAENPGISPPSKTRAELAEERATIIADYYGEAIAATGAALQNVESGKAAMVAKFQAAAGSGPGLALGLKELVLVADAFWAAVTFATGFPIGSITADTSVTINRPAPDAIANEAAAEWQEITVEEPAPGERPIEPAVRAKREAEEQQAEKIFTKFARQVTTNHSGPDSIGTPQTVSEQEIS